MYLQVTYVYVLHRHNEIKTSIFTFKRIFHKNVVNFPCKFSLRVDCVHVLRIMYVQY